MAISHQFTPPRPSFSSFGAACVKLCCPLSSSLVGSTRLCCLSRLCLMCRRYKERSFCHEHDDSIVYYICRHSGCADSDVRGLNTTIVEGPIERHKSRLASRETGDGLTGTHGGGSLDRTESVPKWSRKRRACAGLMVCLLYTSPSPRDRQKSRMPSSA